MTLRHPTALIDPDAQLDASVEVGPYCTIGPNVTIGRGTRLHAHVVLDGHTTLGADCEVYPFAVLGGPPQDASYTDEPTRVVIGDRNTFREHTTVHRGTIRGRGLTTIGHDCLFMVGAHVAHDCAVGDHVTMINNATLAGHVSLGDRVVMGGLSAIHQFVRIGDGVMIGGMTGVERDVIPFGMVTGDRARLGGLNIVGLKRSGVPKSQIFALRRVYKQLFESGMTVSEAETRLEAEDKAVPQVQALLTFIQSDSKRGLLTTPR